MAHQPGYVPGWPPLPPPRRRWYRKKRYVVPLALLTLALVAGAAGDAERRRGKGPAATSSSCPVAYPDQQRSDVCADTAGAATLFDMEVRARGLRRSAGPINVEMCVDVALRNLSDRSKDYSAWDFRLQTPRGEVKSYEWTVQSTLQRGVLVAGGRTAGRVCFSDATDAGGQFVLIYKPNGLSKARATWVLSPS